MAMEEEEQSLMTRVRVVFDEKNGEILNDSQRSEGFNQTWILLKPQILPTISNLSSYLIHIFHLHHSCSNGILLSMDGFVLPPFESTYILKDKDIISIRKKGSALFDIDEDDDDRFAELQNVEKQTGVALLANKEFDKEGTDYKSERQEDEDNFPVQNSPSNKVVSKKRKQTEKLQSTKKKKRRLVESNQIDGAVHNKSSRKKLFDSKRKHCVDNTSEIDEGSNKNGKTDQIQETGEGIEEASLVPNETKKVPSRSARRQYAKRKLLKELKKAEKKDDSCKTDGPVSTELYRKQERAKIKKNKSVSRPKGLLHWKKLPDVDPISDVDDDVVAIVDRPGHIRFEPPGNVDAEQVVLQTPVSMEKFRLTGSTNKKSSRKCRKQNLPSAITKKDLNKIYSEALATEKELHIDFPIDFDNLPPLTSVAEEGDVIAYRLIELSSSWTPELSPFKVGKILWCDPRSTKIVLMPISEKKDGDANSEKLDELLHNEDGKLEVDFKVLIDVRAVKHGNSVSANPISSKQPQATITKEREVNPWNPQQSGEVNPWERLLNKDVNPWEQLANRKVVDPWEQLANREVVNPWEQLPNREEGNPWVRLLNREVNPRERCSQVAFSKKASFYGKNGYKNRMRK